MDNMRMALELISFPSTNKSGTSIVLPVLIMISLQTRWKGAYKGKTF